jgi:hypothetical protein
MGSWIRSQDWLSRNALFFTVRDASTPVSDSKTTAEMEVVPMSRPNVFMVNPPDTVSVMITVFVKLVKFIDKEEEKIYNDT